MDVVFRAYRTADKAHCLALFDENCPAYFAVNERNDYLDFLNSDIDGYELCLVEQNIVGAFGVHRDGNNTARLHWILLKTTVQGRGIGSVVMRRVIQRSKALSANKVLIATSDKAFLFFESHGATVISEAKNGWGPGMHRLDMELRLV